MLHAARAYQKIVRALGFSDLTDYEAVLHAWGSGFWSELDFNQEAEAQQRFRDELCIHDFYIPRVYHELSSERLLVTEWVEGVKLTEVISDSFKND